ncbi:hypothetical protein [Paraburkholderia ferrariae]|uniref:SWIM-type domain-containing protein n=1 Tax=Paraburkholderia ferrariae TaxID=386056 RepID=A0ABU9RIH4_9BURK
MNEKKARKGAGNMADKPTCEGHAHDSPLTGDAQAVLLAALARLCAAGVELLVEPDRYHFGPFVLTPREALDYLNDPDGTVANLCGVTLEVLKAWRTARGKYRCHALTAKGKRCRHVVAGVDWYATEGDPATWATGEDLGRCCAQHGGMKGGA